MLYFITGSAHKFSEVKAILKDTEITQLDIDLSEIQEIDARKIIKAKLLEAFKHHQGQFMVEDTSLYLEALDGLPGPLIKWFMITIGSKGLAEIAAKLNNRRAYAKTIIGFAQSPQDIHFFEGTVAGTIVSPSGESDFGWDPIFLPDNQSKTYAQMSRKEKNEISHRGQAVKKLASFLKSSDEG